MPVKEVKFQFDSGDIVVLKYKKGMYKAQSLYFRNLPKRMKSYVTNKVPLVVSIAEIYQKRKEYRVHPNKKYGHSLGFYAEECDLEFYKKPTSILKQVSITEGVINDRNISKKT